ncbi:MAG: hypothetical protein L0387_26150, partial [Acidobacteria bacterium]|nr:hypothetical protein [Acidobacteriota bacterium]
MDVQCGAAFRVLGLIGLLSTLVGCGKPQKQETQDPPASPQSVRRPDGRVLSREEAEVWRAVERGDTASVSALLKKNPALAKWTDPMSQNLLRYALQAPSAGEDMIRLLI